ncbi:serine hydrolase [Hymenobacter sp. HD11105]
MGEAIVGMALISALCFTKQPPSSYFAPQPHTDAQKNFVLDSLLHSDPQLAAIADRQEEYELQIIYTQIDRDAQNQPRFTQHSFGSDARRYFNPASLVKLPVAALALEKLHAINKPSLTLDSPMATGTAFRCQTSVPYIPTTDPDRIPSVGNYIKRMLLVSDNNSYNRLYEFLGQRPLNERIQTLGYTTRIVRRFAPCDTIANRHTNPITFYSTGGQIIHQQAATVNERPFGYPLGRIYKGQAHFASGRLVRKPYNFTTANYMPLQDITDMLKAILFPAAVPVSQRFALTPNDYAFLRRSLSSSPHSSGFKPYSSAAYFDAYKKYLYYGRHTSVSLESGLAMYNVVGMSHGYLADVAYFTDHTHNTEFMISAVLYVNRDGILNDGSYEYTSIGLPFLAKLGQVIRQYESRRL